MEVIQFKESLEEKGIILSDTQLSQFELYYDLLIEWNEKMNLTAITDKKEVYLKHFYDSITAAMYFKFEDNIDLCDVGAGAGFPSIPIKICFPNIKVSIVDSLNKRIGFLDHLSTQLQLENISLYHDRAETFAQSKEQREKYDVVLARAVARMSVLSELCMPLVRKNGYFVAMKANVMEELKVAQKAVDTFGGKVNEVFQFQLPFENSERNIVVIEKLKNTPKKYPRKPGTPNKSPIE